MPKARTIWPVYDDFPQYPLYDGYTEQPPSVIDRFPVSEGPDKVGIMSTAGWRRFSCNYFIKTGNQQKEFYLFHKLHVMSGQFGFSWIHPRTDATHSATFDGTPTLKHITHLHYSQQIDEAWVTRDEDAFIATVPIKYLETVTPSGGSPSWPTSENFPALPIKGTMEVIYGTTVVESDMYIRQRGTSRPVGASFSLILTGAQLEVFDSFFVTDCGTGATPFEWTALLPFYWGYGCRGDYSRNRFFRTPTYSSLGINFKVDATVEFLQG